MNKKLFLKMFAAATMLLATSCQNDELDAVQAGNEVTVSFTLGVEGGIQSRAISDGQTADRLVYAVFDEEGKRIKTIAKVDKTTTFPATEEITLAKGQTYKVAFWAQNNATGAYVLDDAMNLTIDYTNGANNAEDRDAFFKTETFTVTGGAEFDVVLKRPFAQINVGVTDEDLADAEKSGIIIEQSKVVISNVADQMNLVDGTVKGSVKVEYSLAEIPTEKLTVSGTEYNYLSMSYILPNPDADKDEFVEGDSKTTINKVEFTFKPKNGNEIVIGEREGLNNVPVQRNWRTNIIGKLLTGDITFNIDTDPIYDGENNGQVSFEEYPVELNGVYYKTIEEALAVATDGSVIKLGAGEHLLPAAVERTAETHITLEGQGESTVLKALTPTQTDRPSTYAKNINLVIKNLTYETNNDWLRAGFAHTTSVGFENCTIIGGYHCFAPVESFKNCIIDPLDDYIYSYGATDCTFEGCTFKSSKGKAIQAYSEGNNATINVTIKDCTFAADAVATNSSGKQVSAIDINSIQGNIFTVNISNCTATGYGVGDYSGSILWNIKGGEDNVTVTIDGETALPPFKLNGTYYSSLEAVLVDAVDGDVISVANGTYNLGNSLTKDVTFVGTSKTATKITYNSVNMSGVSATFENLTLVTPNAIYMGFTHAEKVVFNGCVFEGLYFCNSQEFEFNDCVFHVAGDQYNVWTYGSNSTFKNCTFNCDVKGVLVYNEDANTDDVVTFVNCKFNDYGGVNKQKAAIETGANHATVKHTIYINNCTVNGFSETAQDETTLHGGDSYGTNVWGNKNLMTRENLNVYIDNVEVY